MKNAENLINRLNNIIGYLEACYKNLGSPKKLYEIRQKRKEIINLLEERSKIEKI